MPGLITTQLGGSRLGRTPKPDEFLEAGATGYDPKLATVNLPTDTVSGQLKTILEGDNPYVTRARAGAAQTSNARGLVNSTMAAQAGEAAAIDAALPIASQDASTYSQQRLTNQAAENQAFQFGAGAANTAQLTNAAAGNVGARTAQTGVIQKELSAQEAGQRAALSAQQAGEAKALSAQEAGQRESAIKVQAGEESRLQSERAAQAQALTLTQGNLATQLQTLRGTQAQDLADTEATYRQLIQANASAGSFYSDMTKMIGAVMADTNTTADQKQAAVGKMSQLLRSGLTVIGTIADIDLAGLLTFG